jgi:sister chromatid cohesion protein DCC1
LSFLASSDIRLLASYLLDLQPIQPAYLKNILELLLSYLVSMSIPHNAAPVEALLAALSEEHEIPRPVVRQVMSWFGSIHSDLWSVDVDAVLKEVGLGILREHKVFYYHSPCPIRVLTCTTKG